MPRTVQPKVLRLLQEQQFERLGGNETVQSDVRIIAATNQDLEGLVAEGRFRQDLYYRLKVFTIRLPPLRDAARTYAQLVEYFIKRLGPRLGKSVKTVSRRGLDALEAQNWFGNAGASCKVPSNTRWSVPGEKCSHWTVCQPAWFAGTRCGPMPETGAFNTRSGCSGISRFCGRENPTFTDRWVSSSIGWYSRRLSDTRRAIRSRPVNCSESHEPRSERSFARSA